MLGIGIDPLKAMFKKEAFERYLKKKDRLVTNFQKGALGCMLVKRLPVDFRSQNYVIMLCNFDLGCA